MKYLKLFENFEGEDPKWIITSALDPIVVDEVIFEPIYKDTSMFRLFELGSKPNVDKINHLKSWLNDEGYYSTIKNNKVIVTEKPLRETCIDWLNKNYSGMEAVKSKDSRGYVLYRYEPKDNFLLYNPKNKMVQVRYDSICEFFEEYFCLNRQEIKDITEDWMSNSYNLKGITGYFSFTDQFYKSE